MNSHIYNILQLREVFHIEFLRWLGKKVKPDLYAVKGGTNLRLFFKSIRYSEDMDLDVSGIELFKLKDAVIDILQSQSFIKTLKPFGIENIAAPDISKAKQTHTTQRFKVHIISQAGEDLFTKIEFSRRPARGNVLVQSVDNNILREYKLAPLMVSHYDIFSAVSQKIEALAGRPAVQARDIFDIYVLSSQYSPSEHKKSDISPEKMKKARENIFAVSFEQFKDSVLSYLDFDDQLLYKTANVWDDIRLKSASFIEEIG